MLSKLAGMGIKLRWERVLEIAGEAAPGRPHVAQALVEGGFVSNFREAFSRYLHNDGPAYVEGEHFPPEEAIKLIENAGGISVLAHPWCCKSLRVLWTSPDALDDFADEISSSSAKSNNTVAKAAAAPEIAAVMEDAAATTDQTADHEMETLKESMAKFLQDAQNPEFQQVLEQAFRELSTDSGDGAEIEKLLGSLSMKGADAGAAEAAETADEDLDVNVGVAKTLQNMAKAAEDMEGLESAKMEEMGEEMMEEMLRKFETMGEKSDFQDLVDGMMQQLLSKDVMYEPMKQICERYPSWLAEKQPLLPAEDYERYGKQYQYFQRIIAVYESEPDNFAKLSELMQAMQETGQPPSEIVKELAPGLQFDDEGMPVMPNMGPGMFPGMAGMPGVPLGGGVGQEQCALM
ncbi:hypothetical protein P43SY_000060 [Pythium insidiosum]|uniref:Uncharacterized protein n=1 Tax=Pythium insidiosum TaxID=114742 RepID=A0AAD5Q768_PYTIN|nr:hypothetical protein P43SY_000060 [Pythium insidiosum]